MREIAQRESVGSVRRYSPIREYMITSRLRLPFAARWGGAVLRPGEYEVLLLALDASLVVAIHGKGIAAIMRPTSVEEIGGTYLSTLFLRPSITAPEVEFLRVASAGLDLYFQKEMKAEGRGILALPLGESLETGTSRSRHRYDC